MKLTKWSFLKSAAATIPSKFICNAVLIPILITIPARFYLRPLKMRSLDIITMYTSLLIIAPFIHIALLRTISVLYVSKEKEYMFGLKDYFFLVMFQFGVQAFEFALRFFLPIITMKYCF
jgi:hypothetical protein